MTPFDSIRSGGCLTGISGWTTLDGLRTISRIIRSRVIDLAASTPVHIGPSLSVVDILVAAYATLDVTADGDHIVLSKGHAAAALYFVLQARGLLGEAPGRIGRFGDTRAGHPTDRIEGVEIPTGALGHGLAVGAGMALGIRRRGGSARVAVIVGDGELNEGTVWEAAAFAAHHRLSNLIVVVDRNGLQQSGPTAQVLDMEPLDAKWSGFGWLPSTVDGHDLAALTAVIQARPHPQDRPRVVIARTVKGKGIGFMENDLAWHQAQLEPKLHRAALAALFVDSD